MSEASEMSAVSEAGHTIRGLQELIDGDAGASFLGLRAHGTGDDGWTFVLPPLARHVGMPERGVIHGGVVAAFLEAAAGLHVRAVSGRAFEAVEFSTDFLREAVLVDTWARVTVVRAGRRFSSVRVDAWQLDANELVAIGQGRFVRRAPRETGTPTG